MQTTHEENLTMLPEGFRLASQLGPVAIGKGDRRGKHILRLYTNGDAFKGQATLFFGIGEPSTRVRFDLNATTGREAMRELREKAKAARTGESPAPEEWGEIGEIGLPLVRETAQVERLSREEAREVLTRDAGTEYMVAFVRRTDGQVGPIRFRYDPETCCPFDAEMKRYIPVFDLDKQARRFINLDGVLA